MNSGRIFTDMWSIEVNILRATIENNCISIYKLGDNIPYHSKKVSKNIQFDLFLISPNEPAVMGMRSELAASIPCAIYAWNLQFAQRWRLCKWAKSALMISEKLAILNNVC